MFTDTPCIRVKYTCLSGGKNLDEAGKRIVVNGEHRKGIKIQADDDDIKEIYAINVQLI